MHDAEEQSLPAGRMTAHVTRRGGSVLRPVGPWSESIHEYLRHLEAVGFDAAPRVLMVRDGQEELTYLAGEVVNDPSWQPGRGHRLPPYTRTDEALAAAGGLVRRLHEASRGFIPRHTAYRFHPHPPLPGELVCHGDLGPWNTVYRNGLPVALIDRRRIHGTERRTRDRHAVMMRFAFGRRCCSEASLANGVCQCEL